MQLVFVGLHWKCTQIKSMAELTLDQESLAKSIIINVNVVSPPPLREHAPSIIFMDEIDSIGSSRIESGSGGDSEVQRTMLELLNQLDGFEATKNIKVSRRLMLSLSHARRWTTTVLSFVVPWDSLLVDKSVDTRRFVGHSTVSFRSELMKQC